METPRFPNTYSYLQLLQTVIFPNLINHITSAMASIHVVTWFNILLGLTNKNQNNILSE